jgi:DNA-directed RNA polymerase subunit RPC12/RpoP
MIITSTGYCKNCGKQVKIQKNGLNKSLQFMLGCFTLTMWWWFITLPLGFFSLFRPFRCSECGRTVMNHSRG